MNAKRLIYLLFMLLWSSCNLSTEIYKEGKLSYNNLCAPCHGIHAEGFGTLYPNLLDTLYLRQNRSQISCWLKHGIGPEAFNAKNIRHAGQAMAPIKNLSNIEISNILNYLNNRFWHFEEFNINEIDSSLKKCNEVPN